LALAAPDTVANLIRKCNEFYSYDYDVTADCYKATTMLQPDVAMANILWQGFDQPMAIFRFFMKEIT